MLEYAAEYIEAVNEVERRRGDAEQVLYNAARQVMERFYVAADAARNTELELRKKADPNKDHKGLWQPVIFKGVRKSGAVHLGWYLSRPVAKGEKAKLKYIPKGAGEHYNLHALGAKVPPWMRALVEDTELECRPIRSQYLRLGKIKRQIAMLSQKLEGDSNRLFAKDPPTRQG